MKKIAIFILIIFSLLIAGCSQTKQNDNASPQQTGSQINPNETNTQIVNPASKFCIENYGRLEIRTALDGSQTGYCIFDNGKECEEWEYFRGECDNKR